MSQQIIFGLIGIVIGLVLCLKFEWILKNFGRVDWAEEHLRGFGGTRFFYILLGILVIFVSILYMTGGIERILLKILFIEE